MKILIIGPLGAGKSSLAYEINKELGLARLNLDEICRRPFDGSYYSEEEQFAKLEEFIAQNNSWVAEGCQKYLYEKMSPDLIIDMRVNRFVAIWRFTTRFFKAKKLIGRTIDKDLPVQAYHYRKVTFKKIRDYDVTGQEINAEIKEYLKAVKVKIITCKSFKDYDKVFLEIRGFYY
ncbi:MAG: hypothetical protein R3Y43_06945 [Alphaproteobacteria bacterium]